jgi:hypothetical protein
VLIVYVVSCLDFDLLKREHEIECEYYQMEISDFEEEKKSRKEFYAEKIQSLVIDHEITAGKYNDIISKVFENCLGELKQKSKMYRMKFFPTN